MFRYILLFIFFILLNIFAFKTINTIQTKQINSDFKLSLKSLENHYNIFLYTQSEMANQIFQDINDDNQLLKLIQDLSNNNTSSQKEIRIKILNLLYSNSYINNSKINGLQFVSADNTSLIRYFNPLKFNDNISDIRKDIQKVNSTRKESSGFHSGLYENGFRYIYPLYLKTKTQDIYIGALDISFSSDNLQYFLTNISKIHTHFLISKDIIYEQDRDINSFNLFYSISKENKQYLLKLSPKHTKDTCLIKDKNDLKNIQEIINNKMILGKEFSIYYPCNDKAKNIKLVSLYPIRNNVDGNLVAWLVSYEYNKHIKYLLSTKNNYYISAFFIILLLYFILFIIIKDKIILERIVLEKTKKLLDSNENLELKVKEKTKELRLLNDSLEKKISHEVKKSRDKDKQLLEQSKMAALGEMIGNIAHQWRQPLSIISTSATGMQMFNEFNNLDDEKLNKNCDIINENAQYLSKTIDDFKNFIQGNSKKTIFSLSKCIDGFLNLVDGTLKSSHIDININISEDIQLNNYENELVQCLINISNNAKDALNEKNISDKILLINIFKDKQNAVIKIYDNAGGIPDEVLPRIFEPYFTTKHKSQGTGLGLHMTYNLVTEGLKGSIKAKNTTFIHEEKEYMGACFIIAIPIED